VVHPLNAFILTWISLTRILKILKIVTPLCGYTYPIGVHLMGVLYRVAKSVAIFKIFKIRVKKNIFRRIRMRGVIYRKNLKVFKFISL